MLARLTHTVLTSDTWRRSVQWDTGAECRLPVANHRVAPGSVPRSSRFVGCDVVSAATTNEVRASGIAPGSSRCREQHDIGDTIFTRSQSTHRPLVPKRLDKASNGKIPVYSPVSGTLFGTVGAAGKTMAGGGPYCYHPRHRADTEGSGARQTDAMSRSIFRGLIFLPMPLACAILRSYSF